MAYVVKAMTIQVRRRPDLFDAAPRPRPRPAELSCMPPILRRHPVLGDDAARVPFGVDLYSYGPI